MTSIPTPGDDLLEGTEGADTIDGLAGDDTISGLGGDDQLSGSAGNDLIFGDAGDDILHGGADRDDLRGGEGNDQLFGDDGDDDLTYAPTTDAATTVLLNGGAGNDFIRFGGYYFTLHQATIIGGDGNDDIAILNDGYTSIDAGADADDVTIVISRPGSEFDVLLGTGSDFLRIQNFSSVLDGGVTISANDFAAGDSGDVLLIDDYLLYRLEGWDRQTNPFAAGYFRLELRGNDTVLQLDFDAAGDEYAFVDMVTFANVLPSELKAINLRYDPLGAAAVNMVRTGTGAIDLIAGADGNDSLDGLGGDDFIDGGAGDDVIHGGDGFDRLVGGLGNDELRGGADVDFLFDSLGDDRLYGEDGNDWLTVDIQFYAGGSYDFLLDGGAGNDVLIYYGRGGSDHVTMIGGAGNDDYVLFHAGVVDVDGGEGADFVMIDLAVARATVTLGPGTDSDTIYLLAPYGSQFAGSLNVLDFTVGAFGDQLQMDEFMTAVFTGWTPGTNPYELGYLRFAQRGADTVLLMDRDGGGNAFELLLTFADTQASQVVYANLFYNPGAPGIAGTQDRDILFGTAAADDLFGLGGNDVYVVDNAADRVFDSAGNGSDTVYASVNHRLMAGQEVEVLSVDGWRTTYRIDLTGNEYANTLYGNDGVNILDGGAGADLMAGFAGNDIYVIDDAGDTIWEATGNGSDTVYASVSYGLAAGQEIETLSVDGWRTIYAINLTGNAFANTLYGNDGVNILDGGAGADLMAGFAGNDVYVVDNGGDVVWEAAGNGTDTVYASVSYSLAAGQAIETLSVDGWRTTYAINLSGNAFANTLYGNDGVNILDGGAGADLMAGFAGNDVYVVDNAGDIVWEAAGNGTDTVYASVDYSLAPGQAIETLSVDGWRTTYAINLSGNALGNNVYGNDGINTLNGGAGADVLVGFAGADTFAFTTALGGGNVDTIADYGNGADRIALDDAVFTGLGLGTLAAGAFRQGATALDADDRIGYDPATGAVWFDADGNGAGAAIQFATLSAGLSLGAGDFVVI